MSNESQPLPLVPDQRLHWGAALRAARVAKHLNVDDVANRLKLTPAQVEAIESEMLAQVHPSVLFAKGYVNNYAQLLGVTLSSDDMNSMTVGQTLHSINHVNTYFPSTIRPRKKSWWLFIVLLLGVLAWQFIADAQLMVLVNQSVIK